MARIPGIMQQADKEHGRDPIAIVGIGCRFPGGINSPQDFWQTLIEGRDATSEVPADRWDIEAFFSGDPEAAQSVYTRRGGFLGDVTGFDPQFFGISPREAAGMDPQQRLLLEVTWEAFEDAGIPPQQWAGRRAGVFVGLFTHDFENLTINPEEAAGFGPHNATGMSTTIAANRLSYAFDFTGPSMVIDTACSSSLVAVHLACRSLQNGESDIAVAGGVNLQLSPEMTMALCKASMLAPDGRCKSFDIRANGYARADGAGMVVLKTLSAALADGDPVYAVIHGSAANQDGRTTGITVPNGESQQKAMRAALSEAGVAPAEISYVEAHGTGTPVGDPIEVTALGTVLGEGSPDRAPCVIGSVKSNFGHTESAAGVASLIKVALMQRNRMIPPNLHFETPNPAIPFEALRVRVPTAAEPWSGNHEGRHWAGINSFGFGGTNAHLIVGEAPERDEEPLKPVNGAARLVVLSAKSDAALQVRARDLSARLQGESYDGEDLAAIASELSLGREHLGHRLSLVARNRDEAADLLEGFASGLRQPVIASGSAETGTKRNIAFVFSGMGQQWWAMARGLLDAEPVFTNMIRMLDAAFTRHDNSWSLLEALTAEEAGSRIDRTEFAQPAIFAVQVALADLWASWGIRPDFITGHSVGEIAAAHVAGALSLEDAVTICVHRSRLQAELAGRGGMLAVGLSRQAAQVRIAAFGGKVCIAAVNSPESVTLAGDHTALDELASSLEVAGVFVRKLNVELPYHSPVMEEIGPRFRDALAGIVPKQTTVPLVSTVTGETIAGETLDADYWYRNIRQPVLFVDAMATLLAQDANVFVEIGAHPVLAPSIQECCASSGAAAKPVASLRRHQDDATTFLNAVGQLYCLDVAVDFTSHYRRPHRHLWLPAYPWQRARHWSESKGSQARRTGREGTGGRVTHPLLGARRNGPEPVWRDTLQPGKPGYLADHKVEGTVVFPAAGMIELALAAAAEETPDPDAIVLEDFHIAAPLIFDGKAPVATEVTLSQGRNFTFHSGPAFSADGRWTLHASARLTEAGTDAATPSLDWTRLGRKLDLMPEKPDFYGHLDASGLQYGPAFRAIDTVWSSKDEAIARILIPPQISETLSRYRFHPAILDAGFQMLAAMSDGRTFLPVSISRLALHGATVDIAWAYARITDSSDTRITADIEFVNENAETVATVSGLVCRPLESAERSNRSLTDGYLYERKWIAKGNELSAAAAGLMPTPDSIIAELQTHEGRSISPQATPRLDQLAACYFLDALKELGWVWREEAEFTTDELCAQTGIADRHVRYAGLMLGHLAASRLLEARDGKWLAAGKLPDTDAASLWAELARDYPACHAELALLHRLGGGLADILRDTLDPLAELFLTGSPVAEHFYGDAPAFAPFNGLIADSVQSILSRLPDTEPIRILEVGAGTGGLTACLLPLLPPERTDYLFTDVSQSFINQAKNRFRDFPFVRYGLMDAEQDPADQSPGSDTFDLVIASDALHPTADIAASLANIRKALAPGGMFALMELTDPPVWYEMIFGLLPGWWHFGDREQRTDGPTLSQDEWLAALESAGFEDSAILPAFRTDAPALHSVFLAAKPAVAKQQSGIGKTDSAAEKEFAAPAVILASDPEIAERLAERLRADERDVSMLISGPLKKGGAAELLTDCLASCAQAPDVIDLRSLSTPLPGKDAFASTPSDILTGTCVDLHAAIVALGDRQWPDKPRLWVVTSAAEAIAPGEDIDISQASVRGFARVAITELADIEIRLADIGSAEADMLALANEIRSPTPEDDIAFRYGRRYISRVVRRRNPRKGTQGETPFALRQLDRTSPQSLRFCEIDVPPPGPGDVQVSMRAAALNFKDYAIVRGLVDWDRDGIGQEGAGIVTAVGQGVDDLAPGDAVMGAVFGHGLGSLANTPAFHLIRKPDHLSFTEAAGTTIVHLAALHALKRLANLKAGETVLIHTATGGFGLAAIQVAQLQRARIAATAGNEEKRDYLRGLGIAHVFDSRSSTFADEILQLTSGRGADVILNTLPPELNRHNFRALAPATGRLIDLVSNQNTVEFADQSLSKGVSYHVFDLIDLTDAAPDYALGLLEEFRDLLESRKLSPVAYRSVPSDRIGEAFAALRKANHIGKYVVDFENGYPDVRPAATGLHLNSDGAYLVTGGLSGFGLATAHWLAANGARHLVLASRKGGDAPEAAHALSALRERGVNAEAVACDVADPAHVKALMRRFGKDLPALRGIVHAAMVLRDKPIAELTGDDIRDVLAPKADGAWLLHTHSLRQPLDFFICYGSGSNVIGNRNQANYTAANEFMEALMRQRHAQGLPGLSISWGAIGNTGQVASDSDLKAAMMRQGVSAIDAGQAWAAIGHALRNGLPSIAPFNIDWTVASKYSRSIANSPRFELVLGERHHDSGNKAPGTGGSQTADDPRTLDHIVITEVAGALGLDPGNLDINTPLPDLGFDSLVAVELGVALERETGYNMQRMALLRPELTTAEIIEKIAASNGDAVVQGQEPEPAIPQTAANSDEPAVVDDMSDSEVDALLKELTAGE